MPFSHGLGDFMKEPKVYEDLVDLTLLKTAMETALNEYNISPSVVPMQLVLFREAIEHSECSHSRPFHLPPQVSLQRTLLNQIPNLFPFWSNTFLCQWGLSTYSFLF